MKNTVKHNIKQSNLSHTPVGHSIATSKTIKTLMLSMLLLVFSLSAFAQSIETATEKYNAGDLAGAEKDAKALLEKDSNNIDAIELLNKIEKTVKKNKSEVLTKKALIEIDNRNFNSAFGYLKKAILLDPENNKARELFMSIKEVADIEQKSEEEQKNLAAEPGSVKSPGVSQGKVTLKNTKEQPTATTPQTKANEQLIGAASQTGAAKRAPENKPQGNIAYLKLSPSYTFADSNNLDYIDSHVSLAGSRLEADYFFDFLMRLVGFSLDYSGLFLKTTGSEYINFMVHSLDASLVLRLFILKDSFGNAMTIGTKLNYHFFYLYNLANSGVYDFVNLYAPSVEVFISEPIISRIIRIDFLKNLGFQGSFSFLYIGQANAPYSYEYYAGAYYNIGSFKFTAGYRSKAIEDSSTREVYNSIETGAGFSIK